MPSLSLEPHIAPCDLLDGYSEHPPEAEQKWHVVYTRSRHEKSLARQLLASGRAFYLPLISKEHVVRGRRRQSYLPLFSGYVFLFDSQPHSLLHLTKYCISRILEVADQNQLLTDLRSIRSLISSGAPLTVEQRLRPGQLVRVKSGSLKGIEGTIIRRNGTKGRLLVAINYLQQGVSMEIDDIMVEPV